MTWAGYALPAKRFEVAWRSCRWRTGYFTEFSASMPGFSSSGVMGDPPPADHVGDCRPAHCRRARGDDLSSFMYAALRTPARTASHNDNAYALHFATGCCGFGRRHPSWSKRGAMSSAGRRPPGRRARLATCFTVGARTGGLSHRHGAKLSRSAGKRCTYLDRPRPSRVRARMNRIKHHRTPTLTRRGGEEPAADRLQPSSPVCQCR